MIHEHHRKLRSQGGGDEPWNTIDIPDSIHDWIHANPEKAKEAGLIVPEWEDPRDVKITIPEEALKKTRATRDPAGPRKRKTYTFKVPDDAENGGEILDTLIQECRDAVKNVLGFEDNVPAYFVLVAVLHDWLTDNSSSSLKEVPSR